MKKKAVPIPSLNETRSKQFLDVVVKVMGKIKITGKKENRKYE